MLLPCVPAEFMDEAALAELGSFEGEARPIPLVNISEFNEGAPEVGMLNVT